MITLTNISKTYGSSSEATQALKGVSLSIQDGESIAIIGPSGSGKSTLLNILGCMDNETSGDYIFDETNVSKLSSAEKNKFRKENIGFVFQNFALMDHYTAYENIELPLLARKIKRSTRKEIIQQVMKNLEIWELRDKKVTKMSGGQQQRVAIARALVSDCKLLLADEPTGALDQRTGQEVIELLKKINADGTTIIVVTHDEKVAGQMNRSIRIIDGNIESDTVQI